MKGCVAVVFLAMVVVVQPGEAVNCGQVDAALAPCMNYLIGHEPLPSKPCCYGVKDVKALVVTPSDKKDTCKCIKAAALSYSQLKDSAAETLAEKCGVHLDIPVSRTVDCEAIAAPWKCTHTYIRDPTQYY